MPAWILMLWISPGPGELDLKIGSGLSRELDLKIESDLSAQLSMYA